MSVNPNRESITRPETSNKETLKQVTKRARISYSISSEASLNGPIAMSSNEMDDMIKKTIDMALHPVLQRILRQIVIVSPIFQH